MKLVSIDIETTGLDTRTCQILELGAVIFDPQPLDLTDAKSRRPAIFECLVAQKQIVGESYALQMNQEILAEIAGAKSTHRQILRPQDVGRAFREFLLDNGVSRENKITVTGKNYDRFDRQFLLRLPSWNALVEPLLERRTLDIGSLFFCPEDGKIQNLTQCLEKVGNQGTVTHRALDDALAVMTAVTRFFS